ncbi:MAG: hypothetical protein EPO68_08855 [Planctomycetota bacterium]|nr:MAG: hypothetical protein EPO68_08855 [Planctomycetota bacterium]
MLRKFAPLALAATLGFAHPGNDVTFHPADGTTLTKKFTSEFTLRLEELSANAMGQEISPDMMGDPQVTLTGAMAITLTDEFVKVGRGRPLELARMFDELGGKMSFEASAQGESSSDESKLESDLGGKKITYKWDDKDSKYAIAWASGHDGDAKLLEDLEEDMDLRFVLGEGEHKEGDSWEIPAEKLADMLFPGSSFKLSGPDDADDEEAMKFLEELDLDVDELMNKIFDGTVKATYAGLKEVDGQQLAEIQLEAEIQSSNDFADLMSRAIDKVMEREGVDPSEKPKFDQVTLDLSFKGSGTLMWDAKAGHAHSFELNGEGTAALAIGATMDQGGQQMSMKGNVEFAGDFGSKLEVTK